MDCEKHMRSALIEAKAMDEGEVPVGCVIADSNGTIIGRGYNRREKRNAWHTRSLAIHDACRHLNDWRLRRVFALCNPRACPMCAGAIINARIPKVFYGAKEEQSGSCGSVLNLFMERWPHPRWWAGYWRKNAGN